MINRWFLELARKSIGDCRVLCLLCKLVGFWNHFKFEKESRDFERTKSHSVVESLGGNRSARTALLKSATAGDTTGRERYG